jgi:hypothetical protein
MGNEHAGTGHGEPVRIARMSIVPRPPGAPEEPLVIRAELEPALDRAELPWWLYQLRERAGVRGSSGQGDPQNRQLQMVAVQVEAGKDQLEAAARRLVAAVGEANAAYPEGYLAWRRERDAQQARQQQQQDQRLAGYQAVLDNVLAEHRRNAD